MALHISESSCQTYMQYCQANAQLVEQAELAHVASVYRALSGRAPCQLLHMSDGAATNTYCDCVSDAADWLLTGTHCGHPNVDFPGNTIHLISEPLYVIESIHDHDATLGQVSLQRRKECSSLGLFGSPIYQSIQSLGCLDPLEWKAYRCSPLGIIRVCRLKSKQPL